MGTVFHDYFSHDLALQLSEAGRCLKIMLPYVITLRKFS